MILTESQLLWCMKSFAGPYILKEDLRKDTMLFEVHILHTVSLRWIKLAPETNDRGQSFPLDVMATQLY